MSDPATAGLAFEHYEFDARYYIHTAKNNITSVGHVIAEALSNSDEAIPKRAKRDSAEDAGSIHIRYDPASLELIVVDDGAGLTSADVRLNLRRVGAGATQGSRRAFFHRGIREVFMAMGVSTFESISLLDGSAVYTKAIFHPTEGMAIAAADIPVTPGVRRQTGIAETGTKVSVPLRALAVPRPALFTFPKLVEQIENCVQVRPVLMDANRDIQFEFGDAPPRRVRFTYPRGETLIAQHAVAIETFAGTLWAKVADEPIKGSGSSRQTRRYGILVRGERAAYEVSLGTKLQSNPAHRQVYGELRLDGIESAQREADRSADEEVQLIYKTDRSGLNPDHPLVERIYAFLDDELGPLVADLDSKGKRRKLTEDVRRQLNQLARLINEAVTLEDFGDIATPGGHPRDDAVRPDDGPVPPEPPPESQLPTVEDGIGFASGRIFLAAGKIRTVKVWFDTTKIPVGTTVRLVSAVDGVLRVAMLSGPSVPPSPEHGIAQLSLTLQAEEAEGRHELVVEAAEYRASLLVYVRYPRASGFIRDILPVDEDWESGAALYDPQTGRVKVYVGRPEFTEVARRARGERIEDPFKYPPYRLLVVESVREAALKTAAERRAEVEFDDLPPEERQESDALSKLVTSEYQALDYKLRRALIEAFVYG